MLSSGCCVFFFKQKTAYEMRISDWSSDVCSSDLRLDGADLTRAVLARARAEGGSWRKATLQHANLGGATLVDMDLAEAGMAHCDLAGIRLERCNPSGLAMKDTLLPGAEHTRCHLDAVVVATATHRLSTTLADLA